jgi:hypothetical protein
MKPIKEDFDIFVAGGAYHFLRLKSLLPKLRPFGAVHLASITLNDEELAELAGLCDHIHHPRHDPDGYRNFALFCTRDINALSTRPYFVKVDADVRVHPDWFLYVERNLQANPVLVLFGPQAGPVPINLSLRGPLIRQSLGEEIEVDDALKVTGGFYVGAGKFFREHNPAMQFIHGLTYCFRDGKRIRPGPGGETWQPGAGDEFTISGNVSSVQQYACEDVLRSLMVHAFGSPGQIRVIPDRAGSIMI